MYGAVNLWSEIVMSFLCEKCYSNHVALYCNQGIWIPTYEDDPDGVKLEYKCYDCGYRGKITMKGGPMKSSHMVF